MDISRELIDISSTAIKVAGLIGLILVTGVAGALAGIFVGKNTFEQDFKDPTEANDSKESIDPDIDVSGYAFGGVGFIIFLWIALFMNLLPKNERGRHVAISLNEFNIIHLRSSVEAILATWILAVVVTYSVPVIAPLFTARKHVTSTQ